MGLGNHFFTTIITTWQRVGSFGGNLMLSKNECILLIGECFRKKGVSLPKNAGSPLMNLSEVDLCIDCASDILCNEGFEKDSQPNLYGLKLETVIDYLSRIRFSIVDDIEFVWDENVNA